MRLCKILTAYNSFFKIAQLSEFLWFSAHIENFIFQINLYLYFNTFFCYQS